MLKYLISSALLCIATHAVCQTQSDSIDGNEPEVELEELVVKANRRVGRADRNVIFPDVAVVRASVNGRDLIGRLNLPRVNVNPLTGEIGLSGGGNVGLTVNGVICSQAELAALDPTEIVRVEHIDNPGPRYPDFQVLINVVTRRQSNGGRVSAELMNAFKKGGEADLDNIAFAYSRGKSQWTYVGQLMRLTRDNWTRDYSELRHYPGMTETITEIGQPSKMEFSDFDNYLCYSIADDGRYLFNAKLRLACNDTPHSEEADRTTLRYSTESSAPTEIYEHMGESSLSPSLDLYGQYRFDNGGTLIADFVGTHIRSANDHVYRRSDAGGMVLDDIQSSVKGRKYSAIFETVYSQQAGSHRFGGGVRHFQSYASNRYERGGTADAVVRQATTSIYVQYGLSAGDFNVSATAGMSRFFMSQDSHRLTKWLVTPTLAASWTPTRSFVLRYKVSLEGRSPSLAQISDVAQPIDPSYIRCGNPRLNTFSVLDHELNAGWQWRWLSVDLSLPMSREFKPVMEDVVYDDGVFVRTYFNQKSFSHVGAEATVTLRPLGDLFSLSLTPSIDRYACRGNDFSCTRTLRNFRIDAAVTYRGWEVSYNTLTGYANYMSGARLMKERNMSLLMAGYKGAAYSAKIGVLDPFVKTYWMETRDMLPLLSSESRAYSNRPTYFVVQLSLNLSFGRKTHDRSVGLGNSDSDSGLLKATK